MIDCNRFREAHLEGISFCPWIWWGNKTQSEYSILKGKGKHLPDRKTQNNRKCTLANMQRVVIFGESHPLAIRFLPVPCDLCHATTTQRLPPRGYYPPERKTLSPILSLNSPLRSDSPKNVTPPVSRKIHSLITAFLFLTGSMPRDPRRSWFLGLTQEKSVTFFNSYLNQTVVPPSQKPIN